MTVGIDYRRGSSVWGFALGYNRYEITMKDRPSASGIQTPIVAGGTVEADSVTGTIFFDASSQNNVYFTALAGFGGQSFDMARNFIYFSQNTTDPTVVNQTRRLLATPDGDAISASFTLGRTFINNRLIFDPYIGLALDRVTIDRFSESDSGNVSAGSSLDAMQLAFDEQDIDSLRSKLGFQLSTVINTNFGSVRPLFAADWYHEFEDDPRVIKTKYALEDSLASSNPDEFSTGFDNCTSCIDLISEQPVSDYFVVGLGIASVTQRGFQSFLMLESLLGHGYLTAYALTVGFRGQF